jgi:hypothetical protein
MTQADNFNGMYDVRDVVESDRNLILATFLRGLYYGDFFFNEIPKDIFMDNYKRVAEALISKSTVKVACLKDDPNIILGYSILSNDFSTVHWVYVKSVFRKKGIARSLVPAHPVAVTHLSALGKILLPKLKDTVFNPFLL